MLAKEIIEEKLLPFLSRETPAFEFDSEVTSVKVTCCGGIVNEQLPHTPVADLCAVFVGNVNYQNWVIVHSFA